MIRVLPLAAALFATTALVSSPVLSQEVAQPAPVADLVAEVDIPHETFTLDNGLTVIVHEDHKAPVVAVSIWYDVGSAREPAGKTGYAHLFEHIMFNGSENAPNDYFQYTKEIGATDLNGTTWFDRTNYFQTVPRAALESALFLESDRMGHLLGAVTQDKLTNQIGVVQNEKRQGDSQPYGLVEYVQLANLFPEGHPYHHSTIGSMADLSAASLDDMRNWFTSHYGPNNAILVLAGDITAADAKPLVEKWFGDIPQGPELGELSAPVPTLAAPVRVDMTDKVPQTRIYRNWALPGLTDPDFTALTAGVSVLGGLASSRLDNILVRDEQLATSVTAYALPFTLASMLEVQVNVKPGVDPDVVAKRLDEVMAELIAQGPTADEVSRVATSSAAGTISGLEQVGGFGGKATALAEGALYADDSNYYKAELERLAALTPASITAALQKWLTRPALEIRVTPGERGAYSDDAAPAGAFAPSPATASVGLAAPAYYQAPADPAAPILATGLTPDVAMLAPLSAVDRSTFPEVGPIADLEYPEVETATLSNGIKVYFARRDSVPVVRVSVNFDIGAAADPRDRRGTHGLMTAMLDEGTATMNSVQLAEAEERLGAAISVGGGLDSTSVGVRAVTPNLVPSLDLLAEIIKQPAFDPKELERVRGQQLAAIANESAQPQLIALRNLPPLIYGEDHPYGAPLTGTGDPAVVETLTADELRAFHSAWMRPEKAKIFVVGDTTLAEIQPLLEARFGRWPSNRMALPQKAVDAPIPPQTARIIVINQPNSPQSLILAAQVLDAKGTDDLFALTTANDVLGGDFLSRINADLRETKGWSYGAGMFIQRPIGRVPLMTYAPVQTDQTGPSVTAIIQQITDFIGDRGVTPEELQRTVQGNSRELPGSYEQSSAVLGQMAADVQYGRPLDYAETLPARYRELDADALDTAMREAIDPDSFVWLIVGDAAKIKPQLDMLGMPVEYRGFDPAAAPAAAEAPATDAPAQ